MRSGSSLSGTAWTFSVRKYTGRRPMLDGSNVKEQRLQASSMRVPNLVHDILVQGSDVRDARRAVRHCIDIGTPVEPSLRHPCLEQVFTSTDLRSAARRAPSNAAESVETASGRSFRRKNPPVTITAEGTDVRISSQGPAKSSFSIS